MSVNWEAEFNPEYLKEYDQVYIFVQKGNDLDTCAGALALAKTIERIYPEKFCKIVGWTIKSTFLKHVERHKFDTYPEKKGKSLGILVDINAPSQIKKQEILMECTEILQIDHHSADEMDEVFVLKNGKQPTYSIIKPNYASCCELLWDLMRTHDKYNRENKWHITKEVAEILFLGLFSDNQDLISYSTNPRTFQIIAEMFEMGINIPKLMTSFKKRDLIQMKVLAHVFLSAEQEGNLVFLNLNARKTQDIYPWIFYRGKDGALRQKKIFTFPLVYAQSMIRANTFIFVHYSLFDPFNSDKKFVFITLQRENPAIEQILITEKFKKHRNRWSREMKLHEILNLIEKYKDVLTI